jgi:hypothetical protein
MRAEPFVRLAVSWTTRPSRQSCLQFRHLVRTYSTTSPNRSISSDKRLSESISQHSRLPCFTIPSSNVHLIEEPSRFYEELLSVISRAQKRIFIASLYIGKTETELVSLARVIPYNGTSPADAFYSATPDNTFEKSSCQQASTQSHHLSRWPEVYSGRKV